MTDSLAKRPVSPVSGASGKTGWRWCRGPCGGGYRVKRLLRPKLRLCPKACRARNCIRLENSAMRPALEKALQGVEALVIAHRARPSIDLTAPWKVDALGHAVPRFAAWPTPVG